MENAAAAAAEAALHASKRRRVDDQKAPPASGSRQEQGPVDDLNNRRLEVLDDLFGRRIDDLISRRLEILDDLIGRRIDDLTRRRLEALDDLIGRRIDDLISRRLETLEGLIGRRVDDHHLSRLHDDAVSAIDSHHPTKDGARQEQGSLDDLISRLPDDVLSAVISLLPVKEGARTQVLSRRWRPLWRSAPLNLGDDLKFYGDCQKRIAVISKILSDHLGPARCFSLQNILLPESLGKIDGWLRSRSLDNLEELEVTYVTHGGNVLHLLPPSALRFSPTLRVAKFGSCQFPDLIVPNFPHLKQLTLYRITIPEDSLHSLLSACTALESLSLHRTIGVGRLCISSPTLRSISLYSPPNQELVFEDVPCLERIIPLSPDTGPATIQIIRAPKLEILGLLSEGISTLHIGTTVFQKMLAVSLTTKMHTMKILVLNSFGPNLDSVVDFLKCFPCLEKLYVISWPENDMNNVRRYDPLDPIECLELHLKKVVLKNYNGNKRSFVDFAKFFLLNAKVLKEMEIGAIKSSSEKWMHYQRRQLQVENSASPDVQIDLKRDAKQYFTHHEYAHDFSRADPFDRPCFDELHVFCILPKNM
uniref:Uncharacterized protein n=1 Tax=Avena sativa TaxID=4498 RepID=A0ACD5TDI8_AVESA